MPGAVYVLIDEVGGLYGWVNWRGPGGQAQTIEYLHNRFRGLDSAKNAHAGATSIAFQYVYVPYAFHQLSPGIISRMALGWCERRLAIALFSCLFPAAFVVVIRV